MRGRNVSAIVTLVLLCSLIAGLPMNASPLVALGLGVAAWAIGTAAGYFVEQRHRDREWRSLHSAFNRRIPPRGA